MQTANMSEVQIARTMANINRRSITLWEDGYYCKPAANPGGFYVHTPAMPADVNGNTRKCYKVNSGAGRESCTCACFADLNECKHHLAVAALVREQYQADEHDAMMMDAETATGTDRYARY